MTMYKIDQTLSAQQIEEIRQKMLQFACLQIRDNDMAEDLVQESLLCAVKNIANFKRQAAFKTWVFAILKNKIVDYFRLKDRFILETDLNTNSDSEDESHSFFDQQGHWKPEFQPKNWQENEGAVYSEEFWMIFEACLNYLPAAQARVFMMREYLELATDEICNNANISTANLHTLLYRARLQLQNCLSKKLS